MGIITLGDIATETMYVNPAPKITAIRPIGSGILVEILTPQELLETKMIISEKTEMNSPPQARILEIGPSLPKDWCIKVGDRVLLQGSFVPMPRLNKEHRNRAIVEIHSIKAILEEEVH